MTYTHSTMNHREVGSVYVHSIYGRCTVVACTAYADRSGYRLTLRKI